MPRSKLPPPRTTPPTPDLHQQILDHFQTLRIPLTGSQLDQTLAQAEQEGLSHLQFLQRLITPQAQQRRERSIARRIQLACFHQTKTLEAFDWDFNPRTIDRTKVQSLASGQFIRRCQNLVFVGQSGVGKSHLAQALGHQACILGYRVRYITSADLLKDLTASLADQTLPRRLRYYANFELLLIDEFGFDYLERQQNPQAASLFYKVVDARAGRASTAVVTNLDFDAWTSYLGDAPLAMALLDRLVDGAIIFKITGRSYRAARAQPLDKPPAAGTAEPA